MSSGIENIFFALLRYALGSSQEFSFIPTTEDWLRLQNLAKRQSILGLAYAGIQKLPKESQPTREVALQWARRAEIIRGYNQLLNREAARLTEIFSGQGRRSAVLKGPANARLYPDPLSRQCGDIDPVNALFKELWYWRATISLIPLRIKRRRIAL